MPSSLLRVKQLIHLLVGSRGSISLQLQAVRGAVCGHWRGNRRKRRRRAREWRRIGSYLPEIRTLAATDATTLGPFI